MNVLRAIAALVALVFVVVRFTQERDRLKKIRRMDGPKALAYYEGHRARFERHLTWGVGVFCAFAMIVFALQPFCSDPRRQLRVPCSVSSLPLWRCCSPGRP